MNIYILSYLTVIILTLYFLFKILKDSIVTEKEGLNVNLSPEETLYEKKVRKQWLTSFVLFWIVTVCSSFVNYFDSFSSNKFFDESFQLRIFFCLIVSLLVNIPWFWITYHCSYKKRGTAWLMWLMIAIPLGELVEIGRQGSSIFTAIDTETYPIFLGCIGALIYFSINCFILYNVNARYKCKAAVAVEV